MKKRILHLISRWWVVTIRALLGKKRSLQVWNQLIAVIQSVIPKFITYRLRPKNASVIHTSSISADQLPKLAIVIQGPIIIKDSFTLETVKLYKQLYQEAVLILSTWDDYQASTLKPFYNLDIEILLSAKPTYSGESNINFQIVSSKAGVKKARELGAKYVMKTRTDQRLYAPNVAQYLFNIINKFPLNADIERQCKRIVGVSLNTFKYRMYGLSDMLIYGTINDMLMFWDISLDTRKFDTNEKNAATYTLRSFAHWRICEVFLTTEFLIKVGRKLEWTLENSWQMFADHFCVVDKESLDLYWGKYGSLENRWCKYSKPINIFEEMNFREWFNLYCNSNYNAASEHILDLPLKS